MSDFLWEDEISKRHRHIEHKLQQLEEDKKRIVQNLALTESQLLDERIKSEFNRYNTEKTVEGIKNFHATRGWLTEGYQSAIYNTKTNKNTFSRCEITSLPKECFKFVMDGHYYDNELCATTLTREFIPCQAWETSEYKILLPPKGKSTWSFENTL